ncbi:MAG: hypothetical protein ABJQ38_18245 [Flavobacteriaceae bacterium]
MQQQRASRLEMKERGSGQGEQILDNNKNSVDQYMEQGGGTSVRHSENPGAKGY